MSKYGAKTRSHEEKGDKRKSTEASSAKGYDAQADLQAMILGLTNKMDSIVTDNNKKWTPS